MLRTEPQSFGGAANALLSCLSSLLTTPYVLISLGELWNPPPIHLYLILTPSPTPQPRPPPQICSSEVALRLGEASCEAATKCSRVPAIKVRMIRPGGSTQLWAGEAGIGQQHTLQPPLQAPNPFLTGLTQLSPRSLWQLSSGAAICHLVTDRSAASQKG